MTRGFPLSVSQRPDLVDTSTGPVDGPQEELTNDFISLRRRDSTRLWFRMSDASMPSEVRAAAPAQVAPAKTVENPGTDKLVSEMVRMVRETGPLRLSSDVPVATAPAASIPVGSVVDSSVAPTAPVEETAHAPVVQLKVPVESRAARDADQVEQIEWRAVQAGAPVLLLSAGPILESSKPGPILGPGMRYRITSMTGSVVGMEVMHANGDTRSGFANAVDLRCLEPKITTGELSTDRGLTGRLRLTKLATTTFGLFGG